MNWRRSKGLWLPSRPAILRGAPEIARTPLGAFRGGGVAAPTMTWASYDKQAQMSLSNGDLTATVTSATQSYVRSTCGRHTGKYYCELNFDAVAGFLGVADDEWNTSNSTGFPGNDTRSSGLYWNTSTSSVWVNGVNIFTGPTTIAINDKIGMAVDAGARKLWFSHNGTWLNSGNPAAGTNGFDISVMPTNTMLYVLFWGGDNAVAATMNFGATPYTYPAPSGFSNWPKALTFRRQFNYVAVLPVGEFSMSSGVSGSPPTATFSMNVDIGLAHSNRRVIVGWTTPNTYAGSVSLSDNLGSTWNIIAEQFGAAGTNANWKSRIGWAWADITSGTSITLTMTGGVDNGADNMVLACFTCDKSFLQNPTSPATAFVNTSGAQTSLTASIATAADAALLAIFSGDLFGSASGTQSLTSDDAMITDRSVDAGASGRKHAIYSRRGGASADAANNVTWNWANSMTALGSLLAWS